jgi:adenine-specific DNA methylase
MTRRLIETWLPIAALGDESVRKHRPMTALAPARCLHVSWQWPLVASRAAIVASFCRRMRIRRASCTFQESKVIR